MDFNPFFEVELKSQKKFDKKNTCKIYDILKIYNPKGGYDTILFLKLHKKVPHLELHKNLANQPFKTLKIHSSDNFNFH